MVSSGQVTSDSSSVSSNMTSYDSIISELSSSWKGSSYDNLESKAKEFSIDFTSKIQSQMTDFSNACQLYENYLVIKQNYLIAKQNYDVAVSNEDSGASATFSSQMADYSAKMDELKANIISLLNAISAVNLDATEGINNNS